jgi:hypothetical protein
MLPDPGCYEERYRLTGGAALRLAVGLVWLGAGIFWQSPVISVTSVVLAIPVIFSVLAVAFAMPGVIAIARRMIVFRADYAGITLGVVPGTLASLRPSATFIPWAEVERIILYPACPPSRCAGAPVQGIAVQRRTGDAGLAPGTATGTARKITGWTLDRERLTAVTAAVAPGIPIVAAGYRLQPGR